MELSHAMMLMLMMLMSMTCGTVNGQQKTEGCVNVDMAFAVPISADNSNYQSMRSLMGSVADSLEFSSNGLQAALVKYRDSASVDFNFNRFRSDFDIRRALRDYNSGGVSGSTMTVSNALTTLMNSVYRESLGDRKYMDNLAVVFADSNSQDFEKTRTAADELKNFGVRVLVIAIGPVSRNELETIATARSDILEIADYISANNYVNQVVQFICRPTDKVCPKQVDLALVLDQSTSITVDKREYWSVEMLGSASSVINAFPIGPDFTRICLVLFSTNAFVSFDFNRYTTAKEMTDTVMSLRHGGGQTNLAQALRVTRENCFNAAAGDRPDVKDIMILITDGVANQESTKTFTEANATKERDIEIFTLGITSSIDRAELLQIASPPPDKHFQYAGNFNQLQGIINQVVAEACIKIPTTSTSTTTTTTTTTRPPSTTTTTTRPPTSTTLISTTPTTTITIKEHEETGGCLRNIDMLVMIDTSGSMDDSSFKQTLTFVKQLAQSMYSIFFRMALMTFSDRVDIAFYLDNEFRRSSDYLSAIDSAKYIGSATDIGSAMRYARSSVLTPGRGDRSEADNIILLITDGETPKEKTRTETDLARQLGITVFIIGVGQWLDRQELLSLTSHPQLQNSMWVDTYGQLLELTTPLMDRLCTRESQDRCLVAKCVNGAVCRNYLTTFSCVCPAGYGGAQCDLRCASGADVIFALDASGSIGKENFDRMTAFVSRIVESLDLDHGGESNIGSRVGLISYSTNVIVHFDLNTYTHKWQIIEAVNVRYSAGSTNTAEAVRMVIDRMFTSDKGDRPYVPNYLVVLTDGLSDDPMETWKQSMRARDNNINIMAVGIRSSYNMNELRCIVNAPEDKNIHVAESFNSLTDELRIKIANGLCANDENCNPSQCNNGAHCRNVLGGFTCNPCPMGYTGKFCTRKCSGVIDLVFALDVSGSIRKERFPKIKEFVAQMVDDLDIHPDRTRIGLVYFSTKAALGFHLNEYKNRQDVMQAIRNIPFLAGSTNTASSFRMLRTMMFQENVGHRLDAKSIGIIITDGQSNVDSEMTIPEAIAVRRENIQLITVAAGEDAFINYAELEAIASLPHTVNIFKIDTYELLPQITPQIIQSMCNDVDECQPNNPCMNGGRCIDDYGRYVCRCRAGFAGYSCQRRCTKQMDVVLVLDLSGSVEDSEYNKVMSLARTLVYGLDITSHNVLLGVVTYSTTVSSQIYLNDYRGNPEGLISAMNFNRKGGTTNTQAALVALRLDQFSASRGDRAGVPNIAVFITDGYSNVQGSRTTVEEAETTKQAGIELYTVALGNIPNMAELSMMCSKPESNYLYQVKELSDVEQTANRILDSMCT